MEKLQWGLREEGDRVSTCGLRTPTHRSLHQPGGSYSKGSFMHPHQPTSLRQAEHFPSNGATSPKSHPIKGFMAKGPKCSLWLIPFTSTAQWKPQVLSKGSCPALRMELPRACVLTQHPTYQCSGLRHSEPWSLLSTGAWEGREGSALSPGGAESMLGKMAPC